jgi:hypothetical protein
MMEKLAQAGEGGRGVARPPFFTIFTVTYKVVVYALAERTDRLPLFLLYPYMYSVVLHLNTLHSSSRLQLHVIMCESYISSMCKKILGKGLIFLTYLYDVIIVGNLFLRFATVPFVQLDGLFHQIFFLQCIELLKRIPWQSRHC